MLYTWGCLSVWLLQQTFSDCTSCREGTWTAGGGSRAFLFRGLWMLTRCCAPERGDIQIDGACYSPGHGHRLVPANTSLPIPDRLHAHAFGQRGHVDSNLTPQCLHSKGICVHILHAISPHKAPWAFFPSASRHPPGRTKEPRVYGLDMLDTKKASQRAVTLFILRQKIFAATATPSRVLENRLKNMYISSVRDLLFGNIICRI